MPEPARTPGPALSRLLAYRWPLFIALAATLPFWLSDVWVQMLVFVTLFIVLGLGLNVVVGFAGLLDLGYVAFFAAGAYTMGLLTSPGSPIDASLNFWLILPLGVLIAAGVGLLLGLPVLPLRGDYLAIVTLGFGEIIRLFLINRDDLTRGSQGLAAIPRPELGGFAIDSFTRWYYFVLVAAILVGLATARLRDSRIGRAWEAIREDEDVAAAMGVNTTKYKLLAFATGAAIGGLGGVIYASFIGFINPAAFSLQVSIDVLAIVIIGGMGSTPGVIVGSLVLIGIPRILQFRETSDLLARLEWLRDALNAVVGGIDAITPGSIGRLPEASTWGAQLADDTRFVIFGALLVLIMVLRPSGLLPSRRRRLEFAHEESAPTPAGAA
ncbi:branched-chain amino acid ABC transporter permease [Tepidiforma sp.]|uniref:branched-chain amino acid ABC transporter permease n=1 Tax=Tepidiforma sp. TaxID=2682230 RepID=UPI002ADE122A|nr:branched-chain amino acid ABC transporter permease [Tepidiforma sp.]